MILRAPKHFKIGTVSPVSSRLKPNSISDHIHLFNYFHNRLSLIHNRNPAYIGLRWILRRSSGIFLPSSTGISMENLLSDVWKNWKMGNKAHQSASILYSIPYISSHPDQRLNKIHQWLNIWQFLDLYSFLGRTECSWLENSIERIRGHHILLIMAKEMAMR